MIKLFDRKKEIRMQNRNRQRQRVSRKMIVLIGSSVVCLVIAFVIVINMSNVEKVSAAINGSTNSNVVIIPEQVYSTSININERPVLRSAPIATDAQLGHIAKPLHGGN